MTSKWVHRLVELGEVEVSDWRVFSLELVNGETLTRWLSRGARRMLGELPPEPVSLFNRAVAGRSATTSSAPPPTELVDRTGSVAQASIPVGVRDRI